MAASILPKFEFFEKININQLNPSGATDIPIEKTTCSSSGAGFLAFGDSEGKINIVNREFLVSENFGFNLRVHLLHQPKLREYLLSVGVDDSNQILRIWKVSQQDNSFSLSKYKDIRLNVNSTCSCIAATNTLSQIAIGLCNSHVILIRDVLKDRNPTQNIFQIKADDPITGVSFCERTNNIFLFVVNQGSVNVFETKSGNKGEQLDAIGADINCITSTEEQELVIGNKDGIFFFTPEGRGACLAIEQPKKLMWFRGYLIVVSDDPTKQRNSFVTVYDLKNKFIAFTESFHLFAHVMIEWNSLFIVTSEKKIFQLNEKDTQSKLENLFKRNLYTVAIALAKSQNYDDSSITEIFHRYGDHLYKKGDFDGAMAQYVYTIGRLEPSYVIRQYLDAQRIHNLTQYLQALHEKNVANSDHTTLLINCYTKLKDESKLNEFIKNDSSTQSFDVETAIKVCKQAGYVDHALYLAVKHGYQDWCLKILTEDSQKFERAVEYLSTLDFLDAEKSFKIYGKALVDTLATKAIELIYRLCNNYTPTESKNFPRVANASKSISTLFGIENEDRTRKNSKPEDFFNLFVDNRDALISFLEMFVDHYKISKAATSTLLELYLRAEQKEKREKALDLLKKKYSDFDVDHALVLARLANWKEGIIFIYEKLGLFQEILKAYIEDKDNKSILRLCKIRGSEEPNLWIQALNYFAKEEIDSQKDIIDALSHIEAENILPPLVVIQILSKSKLPLNVVRNYITNSLQQQEKDIAEDQKNIKTLEDETEKMRGHIRQMKTSSTTFQLSKCFMCSGKLELPAVYFLCQHSFHQRCLSETEKFCPICASSYQTILKAKESFALEANNHELLVKELNGKPDGFKVVASFFGRGLFSNIDELGPDAPLIRKMQ
eukprot:TRINITY_DN3821_c1_g1_i2.p1 TRINITY_DN3821_c1_g1~~TRINITY_DN3821_c1_g1_i2.p1  ORF type:complete len:907 (-),score=370.21 TRINITY_DN3821_c1_g1_i2:89-2758(-)